MERRRARRRPATSTNKLRTNFNTAAEAAKRAFANRDKAVSQRREAASKEKQAKQAFNIANKRLRTARLAYDKTTASKNSKKR